MIYSVHQPHYIPYPGYLAKVALSDAFVFLEGVQYVRREWQNRNRIKGPDGAIWLTVPVSGEYGASILETEVRDGEPWRKKHIETLRRFYSKAEHAEEIDRFAELLGKSCSSLAELTMATSSFFFERFAIPTPATRMADYRDLPEDPNQRIIEIGRSLGADVYLAGSGGRNYMDMNAFAEAGIEVRFTSSLEVVYPQLHGEFIPNLGCIDLLATCGPEGFEKYVRPLF